MGKPYTLFVLLVAAVLVELKAYHLLNQQASRRNAIIHCCPPFTRSEGDELSSHYWPSLFGATRATKRGNVKIIRHSLLNSQPDDEYSDEVARKDVAASLSRGNALDREVTTTQDDNLPSAKELLLFMIPNLAMLLASPVMSMVDTAVVGRYSGSLGLSSLGPATLVCDSALYLCSFLGSATSNLVAAAAARGDERELQATVAHSLALALAAGAAVAAGVYLLGPALVARAAGPAAAEVAPQALAYSRWRIWGGPAALAALVLQAASLGMKDSLAPLRAVAAAAAANLVGDVALVAGLGLGVRGAAAATAASEAVCAVAMLAAVARRLGPRRLYPFVRLPSAAALRDFMGLAGPLFASLVTRTAIYSLVTTTAAGAGTLPLASHQVVLRVFFFFVSFGNALGQTAQTYLPSYARRGPRAARGLLGRLAALAAGVGVVNAGVALLVPLRLHGLFTTDPAVVAGMAPLAPLLAAAVLVQPMVMCLEGVTISNRDTGFFTACYAVNSALMCGALAWARARAAAAAAAAGGGADLAARGRLPVVAWGALAAFQYLRFTQYAIRVFLLQRHQEKQEKCSIHTTTDTIKQQLATNITQK